jgi:hypothetical protein
MQKLAIFVFGALAFVSCKEGEPLVNTPPDTKIAIEEINRTGENRLNSSVYLSWYGTDADGYVTHYEISQDGENWSRTERRDSTFKFSIEPGKDTTDVSFFVRAFDDDGDVDPTPATLTIPLKNALPEAAFDAESFPVDTAFSILTFRWNFSDPDGDNTVTRAWLKLNEGDWVEIDKNKRMMSLRGVNPKAAGVGDADLFYDLNVNNPDESVPGYNLDGANTVYLKVEDIAGAESIVDTSEVVFVKKQSSDLLLIGGQPSDVNAQYRDLLNQTYPNYDAVDFAQDQGQYQPKFWNPTFSLLTQLYDKLVFNCDQALFSNPITGQSGLLLEFAAPVLQNYTNKGGKSLITTSFPAGFDPTAIRGALPVDSLSQTSGQAVMDVDSMAVSLETEYPNLQPNFLILGLDPFKPTVDAQPLYVAQYSTFGAWKGPNILGAYRTTDGKRNQFFFSTELHLLNKDPSKLVDLFDQILNTDFNW